MTDGYSGPRAGTCRMLPRDCAAAGALDILRLLCASVYLSAVPVPLCVCVESGENRRTERAELEGPGETTTPRDTFLAPTCVRSPVPAAWERPIRSSGPWTNAIDDNRSVAQAQAARRNPELVWLPTRLGYTPFIAIPCKKEPARTQYSESAKFSLSKLPTGMCREDKYTIEPHARV
jgi:hypothetical protein